LKAHIQKINLILTDSIRFRTL